MDKQHISHLKMFKWLLIIHELYITFNDFGKYQLLASQLPFDHVNQLYTLDYTKHNNKYYVDFGAYYMHHIVEIKQMIHIQ